MSVARGGRRWSRATALTLGASATMIGAGLLGLLVLGGPFGGRWPHGRAAPAGRPRARGRRPGRAGEREAAEAPARRVQPRDVRRGAGRRGRAAGQAGAAGLRVAAGPEATAGALGSRAWPTCRPQAGTEAAPG